MSLFYSEPSCGFRSCPEENIKSLHWLRRPHMTRIPTSSHPNLSHLIFATSFSPTHTVPATLCSLPSLWNTRHASNSGLLYLLFFLSLALFSWCLYGLLTQVVIKIHLSVCPRLTPLFKISHSGNSYPPLLVLIFFRIIYHLTYCTFYLFIIFIVWLLWLKCRLHFF